jgi:hypothetical protein
LEHRYGCRPLKKYLRPALRSVTPTEIVLILQGCTLPIAQNWWICIRIEGGTSGSVEVRFGPVPDADRFIDFGSGRNPKDCFKIAKGEVDPKVARRLAELAGKIDKKTTQVKSTVIDGFSVALALVLGSTKQIKVVSCNLAGIPNTQEREPHVLLVREAFATGRALIDAPSGFGSTSFGTGEIQIGDV